MDGVVIIGAGGFGREVHDIVDISESDRCLGFVDDAPDATLLDALGAKWLGGLQQLPDYAGARYLTAVGDPRLRRRLSGKADDAGLIAGMADDPSSSIGLANTFSAGLILCAGARVTTNVSVGRHVHMNLNSTVGHDCVIGDFVTINPGANISGGVTLGDDVVIGTGAAIIQNVTVGRGVTVGAGAVVVRDVPGGVTAVGVPARW